MDFNSIINDLQSKIILKADEEELNRLLQEEEAEKKAVEDEERKKLEEMEWAYQQHTREEFEEAAKNFKAKQETETMASVEAQKEAYREHLQEEIDVLQEKEFDMRHALGFYQTEEAWGRTFLQHLKEEKRVALEEAIEASEHATEEGDLELAQEKLDEAISLNEMLAQPTKMETRVFSQLWIAVENPERRQLEASIETTHTEVVKLQNRICSFVPCLKDRVLVQKKTGNKVMGAVLVEKSGRVRSVHPALWAIREEAKERKAKLDLAFFLEGRKEKKVSHKGPRKGKNAPKRAKTEAPKKEKKSKAQRKGN